MRISSLKTLASFFNSHIFNKQNGLLSFKIPKILYCPLVGHDGHPKTDKKWPKLEKSFFITLKIFHIVQTRVEAYHFIIYLFKYYIYFPFCTKPHSYSFIHLFIFASIIIRFKCIRCYEYRQ